MSPTELARFIDHTLLRPDATLSDLQRWCAEAAQYRFHAVCVAGSRVVQAVHFLGDADVKVAAVVGFPHGTADSDVKRFETENVIDLGAQEVDVVINIGRLKEGDDRYVLRELRDVVEAAEGVPVKVIIECALLQEDEKRRACSLVVESGARFVKTSTGFNGAGASVVDVTFLRECVGPKIGVKAAGGIRDRSTALALLAAGADRLGTSSGVPIVASAAVPTETTDSNAPSR